MRLQILCTSARLSSSDTYESLCKPPAQDKRQEETWMEDCGTWEIRALSVSWIFCWDMDEGVVCVWQWLGQNLTDNFKTISTQNRKWNRLQISKRLSSLVMSRTDRDMVWKELKPLKSAQRMSVAEFWKLLALRRREIVGLQCLRSYIQKKLKNELWACKKLMTMHFTSKYCRVK